MYININIELNFDILTPNWYQGKELIRVKYKLDKLSIRGFGEKFCSYYLKNVI